MSTFDDREKGFEKKFALDAEQEFKASARRNRLLGEWAAGLMGLESVEE
ncbi:MAG: ATPase inhibitor subunit zeta, partial [Pseudomonadota bacterium]